MTDYSARTFLNPWMMCATCRRVLERKTLFSGGVSWQHPSDMVRSEDHPPVPVPIDDTAIEKCDICFDNNPRWVLPANSFQHHPKLPWSHSDWALCDVCVVIVQDGRWEDLYRRGVEHYELRHGRNSLGRQGRLILRNMYKMLEANVTGEPFRKP